MTQRFSQLRLHTGTTDELECEVVPRLLSGTEVIVGSWAGPIAGTLSTKYLVTIPDALPVYIGYYVDEHVLDLDDGSDFCDESIHSESERYKAYLLGSTELTRQILKVEGVQTFKRWTIDIKESGRWLHRRSEPEGDSLDQFSGQEDERVDREALEGVSGERQEDVAEEDEDEESVCIKAQEEVDKELSGESDREEQEEEAEVQEADQAGEARC
ncbi:hypothetical protein K435DRAFT_865849 [Dendrothele bispora CBS 962.96]|uniref:Uncharacterized protein n=1 Tax=Dendrothele bispora (strain CBS 962.96) TaxID=1314807 RepID=A0A4S8LIT0_DENBC|nr:hypothetical protein K435DRAFT_865849 [Dendrothele bispora CBS 962.96]